MLQYIHQLLLKIRCWYIDIVLSELILILLFKKNEDIQRQEQFNDMWSNVAC